LKNTWIKAGPAPYLLQVISKLGLGFRPGPSSSKTAFWNALVLLLFLNWVGHSPQCLNGRGLKQQPHEPRLFLDLFKKIPKYGIPDEWKMAIVTPLHKAGPKDKVEQYRPISNLSSCSKLFERVILGRLINLGELDGEFKHGFKKNRITTAPMLELQDYVAGELDKNRIVGTYSLDLSAAFDLLRPDLLFEQMQDILPDELPYILMDFLSGRKFKVKIGESYSDERQLKIGCFQGSILGPRHFTLYMSCLPQVLPSDLFVISHADYSYISTTIELSNDDFLQSIGMVSNVAKTCFSRKKLQYQPQLL